MKKRRLSAFVIALALAVGSVFPAFAAEHIVDTSKKGSLTIYKYDITGAGKADIQAGEPGKTGYRFEGWDRSGEEMSCVKSNLSINAVWKPEEFSYRFHANGGSGTMDVFRLEYQDSGKLPANQYVRRGYLFLGWSKEKRGKVMYKDEERMHADNPEECKYNLYAIWKKKRANFYLTEVKEDADMFTGDGKLTGGNGTKYQEHFTDSSYAHTDQEDDPGYFTGKE